MAAALIPLIATVAPDIIKLIAGLVHKAAPAAETANGPGTGPVKFTEVFGVVVQALTAAANAGQIAKSLPSDDAIKLIIQAVVSSLNLQGLLGAPSPPVPAPVPTPQAITLRAGQSVTISVA